jgi:hypothetical protein
LMRIPPSTVFTNHFLSTFSNSTPVVHNGIPYYVVSAGSVLSVTV